MTNTGVFATTEETALIKSAANAPLIALNCGSPPSAAEMVDRYALAHGLPEVEGHYGIDLRTGEFISA